ncbi:hypothetical protein K502DRAFT_362532 [Neoconidiobolus thromboides FSU 785]|nr:hypothetical protein K502DRAFT_362532 [Neoconidiobolus thromboides FSU 785]
MASINNGKESVKRNFNGEVSFNTPLTKKNNIIQTKVKNQKKKEYSVDAPQSSNWHNERNKNLGYWLNYELCKFNLFENFNAKHDSPGGITIKLEKIRIIEKSKKISKELEFTFEKLKEKLFSTDSYFKPKLNIIIDFGLRRDILKIFNYYDPFWLSLAIEVCFENIGFFGSLKKNTANNLTNEGLFNGISEEQYSLEISKQFFLKCLMTVYLLDKARIMELIPDHQRLFINKEVKSSKQMLTLLTDVFMKKDVTDITEILGLDLKFYQTSIDEYEYSITELAMDLRDGIKLTQFVSKFLDRKPNGIIIPAKNFDDELNNMKILFKFLDYHGINTKYLIGGLTKPVDIVNGDREKTIGLLWTLLLKWKIPNLIDEEFIKSQIAQLKLQYFKCYSKSMPDLNTEGVYFNSPLLSGLLTWCSSICALYQLPVMNFTSSFEDGQAICYLIAYYFPNVLDPTHIKSPPKEDYLELEEGVLEKNWLIFSTPKKRKVDPIREAVIHNFDLLKAAIIQLGDVPSFFSFRSYGAIDEKLVIIYVVYLANRIHTLINLELNVRKIQQWWLNYGNLQSEANRLLRQQELEDKASIIITNSLRRFKAKVIHDPEVDEFYDIRAAAMIIQDSRRGIIAKRSFSIKSISSATIQKTYNMHNTRLQFHIKKKAAIKIQSIWRRYSAIKMLHDLSIIHNQAALKLQCSIRSWLCKKELNQIKLLNKSATIIQSQFLMRDQVNTYSKKRASALQLQSFGRALLAVNQYKLTKKESRKIQNRIRVFTHSRRIKEEYDQRKKLTKKMQQLARKYIIRQEEIRKKNKAATQIQCLWKCFKSRKSLKYLIYQKNSATKLQAFMKMCHFNINYSILKETSNFIQLRRRVRVLGDNVCEEYKNKVNAAKVIQKQLRKHWYLMAEAEKKEQACVKIQCIWRKFCAKRLLSKLQLHYKAAVLIQSKIKSFVIKEVYFITSYLAMGLQRAWREKLLTRETKQNYCKLRETTLFLQQRVKFIKYFKKCKEQRNLAAITLQSAWKRLLAKRELSNRRINKASATISSFLKMVKGTTNFNELKDHTKAIIEIRHNTQHSKVTLDNYSLLKEAAKITQFQLRQKWETESVYKQHLKEKGATLLIQRKFRAYQKHVRLINHSALKIQSVWKMAITKKEYTYDQMRNKMALRIQNCMRMKIAKEEFNNRLKLAKIIQERWDCYINTLDQCFNFKLIKEVTGFIKDTYQNSINCKDIKEDYQIRKLAMLTIQSNIKMAMSKLPYLELKSAADYVAHRRKEVVLAREENKNYLGLKFKAIIIQGIYQHQIQCNKVKELFNKKKEAATALQKCLRSYWIQKDTQYRSAILLQAQLKAYLVKKEYSKNIHLHNNSIKIQSLLKMVKSRIKFNKIRQLSQWICERREALLISNEIVDSYDNIRIAAFIIQDRLRAMTDGKLEFNHYQNIKQSAIVLQQAYRNYFERKNQAATKIQQIWRGYILSKEAIELFNKKKEIRKRFQKVYIKLIAADQLFLRFNEIFEAKLHAQFRLRYKYLTLWRNECNEKLEELRAKRLERERHLAAIKLQTLSLSYLSQRKFKASQRIAKSLQPLWRGYKVRIKSSPKVKLACQRVQKANREAQPHMILSNRTTIALDILSASKNLTHIIKACDHLVVVTQLSHTCRQRLMEQYHVIRVILTLMGQCNRSQPHQEILRHSVLILENLSRDETCAKHLVTQCKDVEDMLITMVAHKELSHVLNPLMVTLANLMSYPKVLEIIKKTNQIKLRLKMVQMGIKRKSRFPMMNNKVKKDSRSIYSVGLMGLSSLEDIDQQQLIGQLIELI